MNSKIHNIQNCASVGADKVCMSCCQFTDCMHTGKQSQHPARRENLSEIIQENDP
jgi:coenzyme F420-reducing hydrogenase delta subunit